MANAAAREVTWDGLEELRGGLRRYLGRHCADENEVEDVIQETFVRAARYRRRLCEPERLRPWAFRIARNVLSDARRRSQRFVGGEAGEGVIGSLLADRGAEPGSAGFRVGSWLVEREVALGHLAQALAGLRAQDRRLLDSFYRGPESCQRTGEECGIPAHLVKVRLFRARRRLLTLLRRRLSRLAVARPGELRA